MINIKMKNDILDIINKKLGTKLPSIEENSLKNGKNRTHFSTIDDYDPLIDDSEEEQDDDNNEEINEFFRQITKSSNSKFDWNLNTILLGFIIILIIYCLWQQRNILKIKC